MHEPTRSLPCADGDRDGAFEGSGSGLLNADGVTQDYRAAQRNRTMFPVISLASADARYAMTRATSSGSAMYTRSCRLSTYRRRSSVIQLLSVTGGYTIFAVTPNWASSKGCRDPPRLRREGRQSARERRIRRARGRSRHQCHDWRLSQARRVRSGRVKPSRRGLLLRRLIDIDTYDRHTEKLREGLTRARIDPAWMSFRTPMAVTANRRAPEMRCTKCGARSSPWISWLRPPPVKHQRSRAFAHLTLPPGGSMV